MRRHIISTFLMVLCSWNASAANKPEKIPAYKANWVESEKKVTQIGSTKITSRLSQRLLIVRNVAIPVATLSTGELRSTKGEGFPTDMEGAIQQLTNIKSWKKEDRGTYTAFEAPLPDQGRIIKVFISKKKDIYKFSIATIRVAFIMPTYYETELMQREAIGDLKGIASLQKTSGSYARLFEMILPVAHAAPSSQWLADILSGWNNTVSSVGNAYNNGVNAVNNVASAGNNIANAGNNVAGAGNNIASAGNNIASAAREVSGQVTSSVDRLGATFSTESQRVTNAIDRGVNTFSSPSKMGKVAFAAGLGGALGFGLGNVLVQFATDGGVKLAREVFYMITGDLKPEVRQRITERGKKAWDSLEELSKKTMQLDLDMQLQISAMYLAGGPDPMSLSDARREIDRLQDNIHDAQKAKEGNKNQAFRDLCNEQIRAMQEQLALLKAVEPILVKNKSLNSMCADFDQMYERWVDIESEINESRSIILNDTFALITDADNRQKEASTNYASSRNVEKECNFSDRISEVQKLISKNGCICDGSLLAGSCGSLCRSKTNYENTSRECVSVGSQSKNLDPIAEMEKRSELALEKARSLGRRQNKVASSDFGKTQTQMTGHFRDILNKCGSNTVVPQRAASDPGAQKAAAMMASSAPLASGGPAYAPKPSEGRGWLAGIWDALSQPFKWLTGR